MNGRELLHQFHRAGITVVAEAGNLFVRPASALTEAHRQALRASKQELLLLLAAVGDSSRLEEFEERAAIMEFDGGMSRAEAERTALESILRGRQASVGRDA
ncbi:MAG: TubC N-terminal docking domain [Pseudomonadota bacterium]|jgi:hypothetical protein